MGVMVKLASGQEGERLAQKSLDLSAQQLQVTKAGSLPVQDHPTCTSTKQPAQAM